MTYLQNHIGDLAYPAPRHFNPVWAQKRIPARTKAATTWLLLAAMLGTLVLMLCFSQYGDVPDRGRGNLLTFMAAVAVPTAGLWVWAFVRWEAARSGLWRAQRDYNEAVGRREPTPQELQALQLATPWDYADKTWGHSLARFPCEREVGHLPDWGRRFAMLEPGTITDHRAALMEWWGIGTATSYRAMARRLFEGLHSRNLDQEYLASADAAILIDHLAGLSELPHEYIDQCIHGSVGERGRRPPARLWGWDLGRISIIARGAYGAGLIEADEAWRDMAAASAMVRTIFASREEYYRNVRLGFAFWSQDYESSHTFGRACLAALANAEGWPVLAQPWLPGEAELPPQVWNGWDAEPTDQGTVH
ncbi:DUF1266 domain-containing protein [Micropruina sonneratiae]|uniref:DUF1266 domain-containing protein n=1 Tax=Micropruina sonneratiae TaxID=2986940 RepID=UPI002228034E|nr:DUF1266 domain-containing protein [Micropruina sp. KQZ13P-5]MCW3157741.1 DUF1266 domain-containing protein [Micropruina sp. KQZ13P-5]